MGQAHTPSPWQASPSWNLNTGKIRVFDQTTMEAVADVWGGNDEAMANARLIAAAPELLVALWQIVGAATPYGNATVKRITAIAESAIAKAEGK